MICTFGDITDVTWWRELDLPARPVVDWDGRIKADPPDVITGAAGRAAYAELAGKTIRQAQRRVVELLGDAGDLVGDPRPVTQSVKFYERGDRPLEIVTTRQWYFRNGGRDPELRQELLARGRELHWHPPYMRARYESWVEGLNGDWLISRQRFFGVPFPIWYPVDADGVTWITTARSRRPKTSCPSTRRRRSPTATTRPSGASRAGSSATPTSWTPGPRRR